MDTNNSHVAIIKNIISLLVFVSVIFLVHYATTTKDVIEEINQDSSLAQASHNETCFLQRQESDKELLGVALTDKYSLLYKEVDGKVEGELVFMPREKDSKTGSFTGNIVFDESKNTHDFLGVWNTYGEGMEVKEELVFYHDDLAAYVLMGEMTEGGDGDVYVYKNKKEALYNLVLPKIECSLFYEINDVEDYFASNISTIASHQPVLGGTFYVTDVVVNEIEDTVLVAYEDGHIAHSEIYSYLYNEGTISNIMSIKNEQ